MLSGAQAPRPGAAAPRRQPPIGCWPGTATRPARGVSPPPPLSVSGGWRWWLPSTPHARVGGAGWSGLERLALSCQGAPPRCGAMVPPRRGGTPPFSPYLGPGRGWRGFSCSPATPTPLSARERGLSRCLPACASTASVRALPTRALGRGVPSFGVRALSSASTSDTPLHLPRLPSTTVPHTCARRYLSAAALSTSAQRHAVPRAPCRAFPSLSPPPSSPSIWSPRHHG